MSEVIKMQSKATIVLDITNDILTRHKNEFADIIESGELHPSEAYTRIDKNYRSAIERLQTQYPRRVHPYHFQLFETSTRAFMEEYISSDAKSKVKPFLLSVLVISILTALIYFLWTL